MKRSTERILTTTWAAWSARQRYEAILTRRRPPRRTGRLRADGQRGVCQVVHKQADVGIDIPSDGEYPSQAFRLRDRASRRPDDPIPGRGTDPMNFRSSCRNTRASWLSTTHVPHPVAAAIASARPDRCRHRAHRARAHRRHPGGSPTRATLRPARSRQFQNSPGRLAIRRVVRPLGNTVTRMPIPVGSIRTSRPISTTWPRRCTWNTRPSSMLVSSSSWTSACRSQPGLAGKPVPTWDELRRASEMQIEAYNHALRGIPEDRVRYLCWGSMNTPTPATSRSRTSST